MKVFLQVNVPRVVYFLLLAVQVVLPWTTVIDTREGGAQQRAAYVYPSVYTMSDGQVFYGGVEFRGGIQSDSSYAPNIVLGVSAPINGSINVSSLGSALWVDLKDDLTLGNMDFTTASTGLSVIGFQWGAFDGDTTPYNIVLTRDLTVHPNVWLDLVPWSGQGYLDGHGNQLILMDGSCFTPGSKSASRNVVIKNLIIQGSPNITTTQSLHGTSYFQDVSLYTSGTGFTTLHLNHRNLVYAGVQNILGGAGIIDFLQASTGYMRLTTGATLRVAPQTQLKLGNKYAAGGSQFWFDDQSAMLFLDNCSLGIGGCQDDYVTFTSGTMYINGNVTLKANFTGCYLQLGDGLSAANNCNVVILPGSTLIIDTGATLKNSNI